MTERIAINHERERHTDKIERTGKNDAWSEWADNYDKQETSIYIKGDLEDLQPYIDAVREVAHSRGIFTDAALATPKEAA